MTDIVERLHKEAEVVPHNVYVWLNPLLIEAADEIERLQKREQELLEELYQLALKERRHREPGFQPKTGMQMLASKSAE